MKGLVAVGGIVGKTSTGAVIENCYAAGKVQGTYDHPTLGARVAGIAGWHGGGEIRHCFTQVQVTAPAKKGNGGIIGGPNTGNPVIEDVYKRQPESICGMQAWTVGDSKAPNTERITNKAPITNIS